MHDGLREGKMNKIAFIEILRINKKIMENKSTDKSIVLKLVMMALRGLLQSKYLLVLVEFKSYELLL